MEIIKRNKTAKRAAFTKAYTKLESVLINENANAEEIELCLHLLKQKTDSLELTHNEYLDTLTDETEFKTEFNIVEEYREKALSMEFKSKRVLENIKSKQNNNGSSNFGDNSHLAMCDNPYKVISPRLPEIELYKFGALDAIVSFLKSEVQSEEKIKLSRSDIIPSERECKHLAESQAQHLAQSQRSFLPSANELFIQDSNEMCVFCLKNHASRVCKRAFFMPLEEKIAIIKKKGLCRVCLAKGHIAYQCRSQITCQLCSKRHLKFMCPNIGCNKSDSPKQDVNDKNINEKTVDSLHSRATNEVILQTLVVNVHGVKRERKARAIIDTGSQKSYILRSTAEELGFNLQREEEFCHSLFGGTKTRMYKHKCYKIYLSSLDGNYTCKLDALDHDVICNDISSVKNGSWIQELRTKKIFLTDIQENAGPIEVLLGADVAGKLITGRREELETGLVALETKLGWTLMGKVPRYIDKKDASMNIVTMLSQADVPVSSLWDLELLESATNVMKEGMFDLRGWESSAISASSESTRSPVLGLIWDKNLDTLEIDSESLEFDEREKITKRKILSLVSRVFDPIGFLAPVMIQPKILLQATWKTKESWDDEVNNEIKKQFLKWIKQLKYFKNIKIPRWLGVMKESNLSIHTFVDASKTAYAACIFLRSESSMGSVTVQLLQARSRITPMKTITIPRLELMAATIGARLFSSVTQALKLPNVKVYFWTDSSTVLTWITSREQWSVFVTNRISEIRKLTTSEDWFHIPTDQNPADILSRGCGPKQLQKHKWWQGPAWLKNSKEQWPKSTVNINKKEVETEKRKSVISANNTELESISLQLAKRFSRPIQRLYPLELTPNYEQVVPETQKVPEVVTEYPELNTDSNETVPVSRSGREIKPVKRLDL
ncbi:DUF1758 domain-containing protein [Caerostris darwini]|uniref:DUF1758 domain-containing protein n=1 Tax=Caerostris darwini TaxID=1538125 RepID=A0AAV4T6Z0_9ARAC|nr:DUF1758 domain-containing protein [Caerostris darwini]